MDPKISIIIPVYNGEKFISNCINSIKEQTLHEIQIIFVDDGSEDKTLNILENSSKTDNRIEIYHQSNKGVSSARNTGLKKATAKWILFIDADDTIEKDYCEYMLLSAEQLDVDVLISSGTENEDEPNHIINETKTLIKGCLSLENNFDYNIDAPWGKIFKNSIIKNNNLCFPKNLSRSEDAYFCFSYYNCSKKIGIINRTGYNHIERQGSLCRSFNVDCANMLESIMNENFNWVKNNYNSDDDLQQSMWYRVLPGIIECETVYFLNPQNNQNLFKIVASYQKLLRRPIIKMAIKRLKFKTVTSKQYLLRLIIYKIGFGWVFVIIKKIMMRK